MTRGYKLGILFVLGVAAGLVLTRGDSWHAWAGQREKPDERPRQGDPPAKSRFEFQPNGWVKFRPEGVADFDKAKKFGYEVMRDNETGATVYCLAETGALASIQGPKNFELRSLRLGEGAEFIKFRPTTGEAWMLRENQWDKMADNEKIPAGDYDVTLIEAAKNTFFAFRIEKTSGKTWYYAQNRWNEHKEKERKL